VDSVTNPHVAEEGRAIEFTGNWREYLPIAVTNVLLMIVTLGVYRFWATARQRRYLWSRTHVIDDSLEWSGTGKEMFLGFLLIILILLPFFLFIQFLFPALVARGMEVAAGIVLFLFYVVILYLTGVARFRALRYRLSRTWWHGIRGGSDNPGWRYGAEYLGRHALSIMTVFIMFPWASTRMWNSRWRSMSFGPSQFDADLTAEGLKGRWALLYCVPPALFLIVGLLTMAAAGNPGEDAAGARLTIFGVIFIVFLMIYVAIPLLTLHWFAKFYRHAAEATRLGDLEFGFDARTRDWLKLFLGNIGLAIITLGFGVAFWGYRNWAFMVRHTHLYGVVDLAQLTQSTVSAPAEAEGWADAFDVGAI
jgi:uncharacterized membrane protein YjgN (DUF898 family)